MAVMMAGIAAAAICDDIAPHSCERMQQMKPDLCNDTTIAQSACPRFCGLCPMECYHCSGSVSDYTDCNSTKLCGVGEICMIKQLHATHDGHDEYSMTCEKEEKGRTVVSDFLFHSDSLTLTYGVGSSVCDGTGLTIPFGRRDIQPRDLSIHCCKTDLCNYPGHIATQPSVTPPITPPVSTPGCLKDVIFIVDESGSMIRHHSSLGDRSNFENAISLITNVVRKLQIGPADTQISMATYSRVVHEHFDLHTHYTTTDVIHALGHINPHRQGSEESSVALSYILGHAMSTRAGDRAEVPDCIVMITDESTVEDTKSLILARQLQGLSNDIITIEIGRHHHDKGQLATDSAHALGVATSQSFLTDTYVINLLRLICG